MMADRPSACAHCGKRLSRKQWYYRNGAFFCKRRCWEDAKAKAAQEGQKQKAAEGSQPAAAPS